MSWFITTLFYRLIEEKASGAINDKDRILLEKEAELKRMQEMLAAMQAKMQQQQWWQVPLIIFSPIKFISYILNLLPALFLYPNYSCIWLLKLYILFSVGNICGILNHCT